MSSNDKAALLAAINTSVQASAQQSKVEQRRNAHLLA
jgi:hypothetical protein